MRVIRVRVVDPFHLKSAKFIERTLVVIAIVFVFVHYWGGYEGRLFMLLAMIAYVIFLIFSRYGYFLLPKHHMELGEDGIRYMGELVKSDKKVSVEIIVRGYSGESKYSRYGSIFKATGFDNDLIIETEGNNFKTVFYLDSPNQEEGLVRYLDRNYMLNHTRAL